MAIVGVVSDVVRPVLTDADGRFALARVPAGSHVVTASKAGYSETRYGAGSSGLARRVDIAAGATVDGVDIRLPRSAAISGRVVDDFGEPLPNATVSAERIVRIDGRLETRPVASAQTDDLGEYRLFGLPAGRFVIGEATLGADGPQGTPGLGDAAWSRSYYPGVTGLAEAQPISVLPGSDVPAIDFTSAPSRRPSVSITVTDANGNPTDAVVTFGNESPLAPLAFRMGVAPSENTTFAHLDPGRWVALAVGSKGVGLARLAVGTDDEAATIVLTRGGRLAGRVVTDGAPLPPGVIVLEAHPTDPAIDHASRLVRARAVRADGAFELTSLVDSRELRLRDAPRGWLLKDVVLHGRSLLDSPLVFSGEEVITGVEVILSDHQSTLAGSVNGADAEHAPVLDCSVLVFPGDPARLQHAERWARWSRPHLDGRFVVDDLLPGDYLAVAVSDVDETQWQNADYLERYRSRATPVTLGDRERRHLVLELVDVP